MKIVLFSGGSGTRTIAPELLKLGRLTILVNCYDDGLSTGALRRIIPGMLGPSDIRKNVARFMGDMHLNDRISACPSTLSSYSPGHPFSGVFCQIKDYLKKLNHAIDDCAVGNLVFAGLYLILRDFNAAVREMSRGCPVRILNITSGENGWLTDELGRLSEYQISTQRRDYALKQLRVYGEPGVLDPNPEALMALRGADVIVYGPGTQHSSLLPSYMTRGVRNEIALNVKAHKVYIANAARDIDIPTETVSWLISKLHAAMHGWGLCPPQGGVGVERLVDTVLDAGGLPAGDLSAFRVVPVAATNGVHDGESVAAAISQLI